MTDNLAEAVRLFEEPITYWREVGNVRSLSLVTQNLGLALSSGGQHERADRAARRERRAGAPRGGPGAPVLRAPLARPRAAARRGGARPGARAAQGEPGAVARARRPPGPDGVPGDAGRSSARAAPLGAELIGAAEGAREAAAAARQPDEEPWVAEVKARLREALGEDAFEAAAQSARGLKLTDAVEPRARDPAAGAAQARPAARPAVSAAPRAPMNTASERSNGPMCASLTARAATPSDQPPAITMRVCGPATRSMRSSRSRAPRPADSSAARHTSAG